MAVSVLTYRTAISKLGWPSGSEANRSARSMLCVLPNVSGSMRQLARDVSGRLNRTWGRHAVESAIPPNRKVSFTMIGNCASSTPIRPTACCEDSESNAKDCEYQTALHLY